MQVRSVSSNVQLPELPDAKIETRKPMRSLAGPQNAMDAAVEDVRKRMGRRQFNLRGEEDWISTQRRSAFRPRGRSRVI